MEKQPKNAKNNVIIQILPYGNTRNLRVDGACFELTYMTSNNVCLEFDVRELVFETLTLDVIILYQFDVKCNLKLCFSQITEKYLDIMNTVRVKEPSPIRQ